MRLKRRFESLPKARKRAASQSTDALYNWVDQGLYSVGSTVNDARRGMGMAALKEAEQGILVLLEVCRELQARQPS